VQASQVFGLSYLAVWYLDLAAVRGIGNDLMGDQFASYVGAKIVNSDKADALGINFFSLSGFAAQTVVFPAQHDPRTISSGLG
jgi:hypothetical protein